ncbi:unnamed protein product [marine sediment metagenome]|uniref:Uncharacterized protein n=1 Tax=marine sediment metagenome TaxID=412755 RepID=X1CM60_9ZZZZ
MKYWLINSYEVTNFTLIKCREKPKIYEICETEYNSYKNWLEIYVKLTDAKEVK